MFTCWQAQILLLLILDKSQSKGGNDFSTTGASYRHLRILNILVRHGSKGGDSYPSYKEILLASPSTKTCSHKHEMHGDFKYGKENPKPRKGGARKMPIRQPKQGLDSPKILGK